jgi:ADP-ribose pyrophosphatase YjhB (NUDIX family)
VRAVWLRLATEASRLLPEAIDQGFLPHHAAPDHITLTAWLREGTASRLPPGPSRFVGVAGMVMAAGEQGKGGKVLVVQEKSGPAAGINLWKLPGGLVDSKEDISTAAVREVLEETGVRSEFQRLMTIQENHQIRGPGREGSTDLFCICFLTPVLGPQGELPEPVAQEDEIAECRWMDVAELLQQPLYEDGIFNVMINSALQAATSGCGGLKCDRFPLTFRPGMSALMYPDLGDDQK